MAEAAAQDHAHIHDGHIHDRHGHLHPHVAAEPGFSLLRLSAGGRLIGAALLIALMWLAVYGALA